MAEVFGVASGALQVADAGIKLAKTLYEYLDAVRNANKQLESVALQVKVTSSTLRSLGELLEDHEAEKVCSQHVVDDAQLAFKGCEKTFLDVEDTFRALIRSEGPSIGKVTTAGRWVYPFKKGKLEALQANLERLKTTLLLMLSVLTYARESKNRSVDNKSKLEDQKRHIQTLMKERQQATKRHEEVLAAFSRLDTNDQAQPPPTYHPQADLNSTTRDVGGMGTGVHMHSFMVTSTIPSVTAPPQVEPVQQHTELDKQRIIEHLSNCAEAVSRLSQEINKAASMFSFNKTTTLAPIDQSFRHVTEKVHLMLQETKHPGYPPSAPIVSTTYDLPPMIPIYEQQLERLEQQGKTRHLIARSSPPSQTLVENGRARLQPEELDDYQMQLMLLEQQNKNRREMEGQYRKRREKENQINQDKPEKDLPLETRAYQPQMQRMAQQSRPQGAQMSLRQQDSGRTSVTPGGPSPQMMLMRQQQLLAAQQNQKRLMEARQQQNIVVAQRLAMQNSAMQYQQQVQQAQQQQSVQQSASSVSPPLPVSRSSVASHSASSADFEPADTLEHFGHGDVLVDFDFDSFLNDGGNETKFEFKDNGGKQDEDEGEADEDMEDNPAEIHGEPMSPAYSPVSAPHSMEPPLPLSAQSGSHPPTNLTNSGTQPQGGTHALSDFQMQLMLLEQQNKKRVMMARQEQDSSAGASASEPPVTFSADDDANMDMGMARRSVSPVNFALTMPENRGFTHASASAGVPEHPIVSADDFWSADMMDLPSMNLELGLPAKRRARRTRAQSDMQPAVPTTPSGGAFSSTPSEHRSQNTVAQNSPAMAMLNVPMRAGVAPPGARSPVADLNSPMRPSAASRYNRDRLSGETTSSGASSSVTDPNIKSENAELGEKEKAEKKTQDDERERLEAAGATEAPTDSLLEKLRAERPEPLNSWWRARRSARRATANSQQFMPRKAREGRRNPLTGATVSPDASDDEFYKAEFEAMATLSSAGETNKRVQRHPGAFSCTMCDRTFTRVYNLTAHLRTHTDNEKSKKKKRLFMDESAEVSAGEDDAAEDERPTKRQERDTNSTETLTAMDTDAPLLGAEVDDVDDLLRLWTTVGVE